jgi:2-oxoglutarate ferredoxin oxidoreductase subunit alpha
VKSLIVAGRAGQGVQLISRAIARALVRAGYYVFVSQDVMSRIRGGHNFARLCISDHPVGTDADAADVVVALDSALLDVHQPELAAGGLMLDGSPGVTKDSVIHLPLDDLARRHGRGTPSANAVAAGGAMALLGAGVERLCSVLAEQFAGRGQQSVAGNVAAARAGFEYVRTAAPPPALALPDLADPGLVLVSGAEALALGAIAANVRVVAGYPMSPGTPVLEYCARHAEEAELVVEQTEDEIAAANLAIGASYAGARAMVATSGGGFALMNEALSLAGMIETPLVICLGMRPGPATGMATRTAQADLLSVIYAGHGEFARAVFAPANALEGFGFVQSAFRVADRFQSPAIVLFDQFMGDALWTVRRADLVVQPVERFDAIAEWQTRDSGEYCRYAASPGGVSPLLWPGFTRQLVCADSDEHSEDGHITERADVRRAQVEKRAAKLAGIAGELPAPEVDFDGVPRNVVFTFGSVGGIVREAAGRLRARGRSIAVAQLRSVWPFPTNAVHALCGGRERVLTVEGNYGAQLAQLIAQECRLRVAGSVRRWDGRQFRVGEVESELEELISG